MSYIDLLLNDDFMKDLINSIDICNEKIIKTKNQKLRSTASCRVWQLKLSIINYYLKKYYSSILSVDIVTEICIIINNFLSSKPNTDSILHRLIFFNQPILIIEDMKHSHTESRFHALGITNSIRCLHVTFTLRSSGSLIRVNSARDMHKKERMVYEQTEKDT